MAATYPCRRCKAPLERAQHIVFSHIETYQQPVSGSDPPCTRTAQEMVFKHAPCPHCGEPRPLATLRANLPTVLALALIFGLMALGLYVFFSL